LIGDLKKGIYLLRQPRRLNMHPVEVSFSAEADPSLFFPAFPPVVVQVLFFVSSFFSMV